MSYQVSTHMFSRHQIRFELPHCQVVQPDVGRVEGLTEAMRVCELARDRNKIVVPHCWKTGIGIAGTLNH